LIRFGFRKWGDIDFLKVVSSAAENSNKFQKTRVFLGRKKNKNQLRTW
jgi:hypothetical protein